MQQLGPMFAAIVFVLSAAACNEDTAPAKDTGPATAAEATTADAADTMSAETATASETSGETAEETVETVLAETEADSAPAETEEEVVAETVAETVEEVTAETSEPFSCEHLPTSIDALIVSVPGFTNSEDFQFDGEGHYVGVDGEGNLVKITKEGKTSLFVPQSGAAAGMRFLANGDLVFAGSEALYRATPDGVVTPILGGLAYPNGVEVDLDGFIYVAEQNAGRVRRVDPATGEFTIVARGLLAPNGLSFAPDYRTLYCGSFGYGVVYKIPFDSDGYPEATGILTVMPGVAPMEAPQGPTDASKAACDAHADGDACTFDGTNGACVTLGRVLYCDITGSAPVPTDPCKVLQDGDACGDGTGLVGVCALVAGVLTCVTDPLALACVDHAADAACTYKDNWSGLTMAGTCGLAADSQLLYCNGGVPADPAYQACTQSLQNDACNYTSEGVETTGTCIYDNVGYLFCSPPIPRYPEIVACSEHAVGDGCSFHTRAGLTLGTCQDDFGVLYCAAMDPAKQACLDKHAGQSCTFPGAETAPYECSAELLCVRAEPWRKACGARREGDACQFAYNGAHLSGACTTQWDGLLCQPELGKPQPDACIGTHDSATCAATIDGTSYPGTCTTTAIDPLPMGFLLCVGDAYAACTDKAGGDACAVLGYDGLDVGTCDNSFGQAYCTAQTSSAHTNLDGVEVDACGNVYVTEYIAGILWRITPDGSKLEELAHLPAQWIPNLHWGNGQGGFARDRLYVQNRDDGSLFELDVGVPGKHRNQP